MIKEVIGATFIGAGIGAFAYGIHLTNKAIQFEADRMESIRQQTENARENVNNIIEGKFVD